MYSKSFWLKSSRCLPRTGITFHLKQSEEIFNINIKIVSYVTTTNAWSCRLFSVAETRPRQKWGFNFAKKDGLDVNSHRDRFTKKFSSSSAKTMRVPKNTRSMAERQLGPPITRSFSFDKYRSDALSSSCSDVVFVAIDMWT